jgi:hypothetical protein
MAATTEFGKFLRTLRIQRDISARELSEYLGVTAAYLSAVETGKRNIPAAWESGVAEKFRLTQSDRERLREAITISSNGGRIRFVGPDGRVYETNRKGAKRAMKRKNKNRVEFDASGEEVIAAFTESVTVNKKTAITVPRYCKAFVYIDDKLAFRTEPCADLNIAREYGKEFIGRTMKAAFVSAKALPQLAWGFGNIQVNNTRLKEAYRIGANGKYVVEVVDFMKLIAAFPTADEITVEKIKDKTLSIVKTVGVPILSGFFAFTDISVFEINSKVNEIREAMLQKLKEESLFGTYGIRITAVTVDALHVNEDDIEIIRNRINFEE